MASAIVLIDGNNFYASCEAVLDPGVIGRPLVVLSNNDGCIVSRSAEARALGIPMGAPYFQVQRQLQQHQVIVRSSNYGLYADMSQRLMATLEPWVEELEVYSIDEAFGRLRRPPAQAAARDRLGMPRAGELEATSPEGQGPSGQGPQGQGPEGPDLTAWGQALRQRVRRDLGLPVAIGIAPTKVLAKLANRIAKQDPQYRQQGVFDLAAVADPDPWLEAVAIEEVWGIGRQLSRWCRLRGIANARQLRDMPPGELRRRCGVVGLRLQLELRGSSCLPLLEAAPTKQETCVSRSFSTPITTRAELREAVATYLSRAAEKLRRQQQLAAAITVFVRSSPFDGTAFYSNAATVVLPLASQDTAVLLKAALPLTDQLFRPHKPLRKAGVLLQGLQPENLLQHHLLAPLSSEEQARREALLAAVDGLNRRFGRGTLQWAACGLSPAWTMRRSRLSRAATTRLSDVPVARA